MENQEVPFWHGHMFRRLATALLGLSALFLVVATIAEYKEMQYIGATPGANTVSVSGEGEVFAVPDLATFSFSVVEESDMVEDAQATAAEKINAAIAYLEDAGVEEKDIKTTAYNVFPQYDYLQQPCTEFSCPPGRREFRGFEVRQTISVKVRDTEEAGELLSSIGEFGVNDISGLSFTIEDEDELQSEARELAIDDARDKAEELADQLGVRIVRVVSFNESGPGLFYRGVGGADAAVAETSAAVPDVPAGENRITSFVTVIYEIR